MSDERAAQYAASVAGLAQDKRFAARSAELTALSADLADPSGDVWAGVDLFAAFRPDASIDARPTGAGRIRGVLEQWLGVLAAVSVFAPVGWTWIEFRRASAAYEDMIADAGEPEGRTFLGLWATGFDERLGPGSHLAPVATMTVSLIIVAVAFIVGHRLMAGANVRREERDFQLARITLSQTLTGASLILNERRADHPQRIEGIIRSSLDKLRKTQDAARKAVSELSVTAVNVGAGVNELLLTAQKARTETEALLAQARTTHEALGSAVTAAGHSVTGAITSLDGVVRTGVEVTQAAVTQSVGALDTSVQLGIQASNDNARVTAQQLSEQLAAILAHFEQDLGAHVQGLQRESVAAIGSSGTALMGVVDRIGGSTEASAAAAAVLADQVTAMRDDTSISREELRHALDDVRTALGSIEIALSRHASTLQDHASELTGTRDAAERMLRQLTTAVGSANGHNGGSHVEVRP